VNKNKRQVQNKKIYDVEEIQKQLEELTEDGKTNIFLIFYRGRNKKIKSKGTREMGN